MPETNATNELLNTLKQAPPLQIDAATGDCIIQSLENNDDPPCSSIIKYNPVAGCSKTVIDNSKDCLSLQSNSQNTINYLKNNIKSNCNSTVDVATDCLRKIQSSNGNCNKFTFICNNHYQGSPPVSTDLRNDGAIDIDNAGKY